MHTKHKRDWGASVYVCLCVFCFIASLWTDTFITLLECWEPCRLLALISTANSRHFLCLRVCVWCVCLCVCGVCVCVCVCVFVSVAQYGAQIFRVLTVWSCTPWFVSTYSSSKIETAIKGGFRQFGFGHSPYVVLLEGVIACFGEILVWGRTERGKGERNCFLQTYLLWTYMLS